MESVHTFSPKRLAIFHKLVKPKMIPDQRPKTVAILARQMDRTRPVNAYKKSHSLSLRLRIVTRNSKMGENRNLIAQVLGSDYMSLSIRFHSLTENVHKV